MGVGAAISDAGQVNVTGPAGGGECDSTAIGFEVDLTDGVVDLDVPAGCGDRNAILDIDLVSIGHLDTGKGSDVALQVDFVVAGRGSANDDVTDVDAAFGVHVVVAPDLVEVDGEDAGIGADAVADIASQRDVLAGKNRKVVGKVGGIQRRQLHVSAGSCKGIGAGSTTVAVEIDGCGTSQIDILTGTEIDVLVDGDRTRRRELQSAIGCVDIGIDVDIGTGRRF